LLSSTKESGQTALSNSSLITTRPGLLTQVGKYLKGLRRDQDGCAAAHKCPPGGSSSNSSNRYKSLKNKGIAAVHNYSKQLIRTFKTPAFKPSLVAPSNIPNTGGLCRILYRSVDGEPWAGRKIAGCGLGPPRLSNLMDGLREDANGGVYATQQIFPPHTCTLGVSVIHAYPAGRES
jgi:hypothetical protein